jgi:methyl-accepting chemotaxis protein
MPTTTRKFSSRKIVTPLTGALSLVIGISGVMLFFHFEEGLVKGVHEWLGMAFAAIMLVHLIQNWKAFKQHFRKPAAWVGTGIVSAISVVFLVSSLTQPIQSPIRSIIHSLETTAVYDLAPVFKVSHLEMSQRFDQAGVVIVSGQETIQELADNNGVDPRQLMVALTKKPSK